MQFLLEIKNSSTNARPETIKHITKVEDLFSSSVFSTLIGRYWCLTLEDMGRHLLLIVNDRVIFKMSRDVWPAAQKLLVIIEIGQS